MAEMKFTLLMPGTPDGAVIGTRYTCDGDDVSPKLEWSHAPAGTKSFALMVEDPDAPRGVFTHWLLCDIHADRASLEEGESGAGIAGRNDGQGEGYMGPCPPPNHGQHRYYFNLYALDVESLGLKSGVGRTEFEKAMEGHILGHAQFMVRYERRTG